MYPSQGHDISSSPNLDPDERRQRVLRQFHAFPFSSNEAFQQGLSAILAHESMNQLPDNEASELILKTKVFYFNRVTGHDIKLEDVQAGDTADLNHLAEGGDERNQTSLGAEQGEIHTLTFAELMKLIEEGKTENIPNNKIIPDVLSNGPPSESTAPMREKPWEAASQSWYTR